MKTFKQGFFNGIIIAIVMALTVGLVVAIVFVIDTAFAYGGWIFATVATTIFIGIVAGVLNVLGNKLDNW